MFGKKSVETLVVGAGPSGMIAALALAQKDVGVMLLDAADRPCTRSNALLLHPTTLKLLDRLGLSERVVEAGYRIDKVLVYDDAQPRETVRLNELPVAFPFAVSIPQWELESILESELQRAGVKTQWGHRVSELEMNAKGVVASVDRYSDRDIGYAVSHTEKVVDKSISVKADFVLAADGYNSNLRRYSKSELKPLGPGQGYAFFEFETDMDPDHAVRVSYKGGMATAQYPMIAGTARLAFELADVTLPEENRDKEREPVQEEYEYKEQLSDSRLKEMIQQRVPWTAGYINRVRYRAMVPFEKRHLTNPLSGRIFFLGDAARHFGPLSMTGINLGIQEAEQVARALVEAKDGPELEKLQQLGQGMAAHWRAIADLERVSTPIEMADPWVAQNRGRILRALPATGDSLERLATQLFLHIKLDELVGV